MRAPSILLQCLPSLLPHDRGSQSMSITTERDVHCSSPAVEMLPSKVTHFSNTKESADNADFQPTGMFKGKPSVMDIIGLSASDTLPMKPEGYVKTWDSFMNLISVLKQEIRDGQLNFRGKRVLELGCSSGFPGIFACLKGASTVHFQDVNAETIRCSTIPTVLGNLEQAREWQSRQTESPVTPSMHSVSPLIRFYAGEWGELHAVLSVVKCEGVEATPGLSRSFSEEDFMDGCSSQDGSIATALESSSRRSRKLSGSQAWDRASVAADVGDGYDIILMADIPYSLASLKKLYSLIKKCVRPRYGVMYLGTRKNCVGLNSTVRSLRAMVDEEGLFRAHLVRETPDRDVWKFFVR